MGIAIFLRTTNQLNYFRELMVRMLEQKLGDSVILCSGFFQENHGGKKYQVSQERGFASILAKNNIDVTTIGVHNNIWKPAYINFVNTLKNNGVKLTAYVTSSLRWHAKVFILKKSNRPIFGIVGSSNMTRNAFGVSNPYNYEADCFLWVNRDCDRVIMGFVENTDKPYDIIIAKYEPQDNKEITIEQRLNYLEDQVMSSKLQLLIE